VTDASITLARKYIREGRTDVIQLIFSVLRQGFREVFEEAADQGVGIVCRAALEHGFLSEKYDIHHQFEGFRSKWTRSARRRIFGAVEDLTEIASQARGIDVRTLALQFVLAEPHVSSVVVGAVSPKQVIENLEASRMPLLDPTLRTQLIRSYGNANARMNTGQSSLYHRLWKRITGMVFR
jgi:aryl-alcohol dehydrogenase-like predicted oxidoreductase